MTAQICAHLNLHLPVRDYGEVAALVAKGAVCDLFGFGKRRVSENSKSDLLRTYPAGKIYRTLYCPKRKWLPDPGSISVECSQAGCLSEFGSKM